MLHPATLLEQTEVVELDLVFLHRVKSAGECACRGVRRYVILGAGLDTFTQRRPEVASVPRVFEVDQPQACPPSNAEELLVATT